MNLVTAIYVGLLLLGGLWAAYRVVAFLRRQKARDSAWNETMSPEELRAYLETVKQNAASKQASLEADALPDKKDA